MLPYILEFSSESRRKRRNKSRGLLSLLGRLGLLRACSPSLGPRAASQAARGVLASPQNEAQDHTEGDAPILTVL